MTRQLTARACCWPLCYRARGSRRGRMTLVVWRTTLACNFSARARRGNWDPAEAPTPRLCPRTSTTDASKAHSKASRVDGQVRGRRAGNRRSPKRKRASRKWCIREVAGGSQNGTTSALKSTHLKSGPVDSIALIMPLTLSSASIRPFPSWEVVVGDGDGGGEDRWEDGGGGGGLRGG